MPVIQTIKGKVPWLFRSIIGNIWQRLTCVVQAIVFSEPFYNETSGFWEYKDQVGTRDGVLDSNVANFDGVNDYISGLEPMYSSTPNVQIEFDFKSTDTSAANKIIYSESVLTGLNPGFGILINPTNNINVIIRNDVGTVLLNAITAQTYADGNIYCLKWVDNNGSYNLSINGVSVLSGSYIPSGTINFTTATIAAYLFTSLSSPYEGIINNLKQYKNGTLRHRYKLDEADGSVIYDSVVGGINGTANNIDVNTFWATDNDFTSFQNEVGYSEGTGDQLIPAQVDTTGRLTGKDALGNSLQNKGQVRLNAQIVNSNVYEFDGVDDFIQISDNVPGTVIDADRVRIRFKTSSSAEQALVAGFISNNVIVIQNGFIELSMSNLKTSTAFNDGEWHEAEVDNTGDTVRYVVDGVEQSTVAGASGRTTLNTRIGARLSGASLLAFDGKIDRVQAWSGDTELANFKASEGGGDVAYDSSVNANHGTITNANLTTFHALDNSRPDNLLDGFDLWQDDVTPTNYLRVPFDVNGNSIKTSGDTITGFTWVSRNPAGAWHNGAESEILQYPSNQMFDADSNLSTPYWSDGAGTMVAKSYDDFVTNGGNIENQIVYNLNPLKQILTFENDARTESPDCFTKALNLIGRNEQLFTNEGLPVLDENGVSLYVLK